MNLFFLLYKRVLNPFVLFCRWINQGSRKPLPRSDPKYLKSYFYIKTDSGKCDKGFRREVYFPVQNSENIAVIHYIGDENLSDKAPHGNAKHGKPFFRTKPSVLKDLQERPEIEKAHKIYKDMVCENKDGHEAVSKPRNVKQVHNIKAAQKEEVRLTRDAIYNTHEIAYEGGFVHYIATFPDLAVIAGSQDVIQDLNNVIKLKDPDFLFSYDTTFSLGEFYVSPLVFKHILFERNPLVAALFLVHERKLQETHDIFFKKLGCLVKSLRGVPIVTDMETAIVKSIKENTPLTQMGCWRHLRQDVQRWLADNLPRDQRNSYIDDLYGILRSKEERSCRALIERKKASWYPQFRQYFERNVEPKLEYFCIWSIDGKCKYDKENGITTNQSEGFNFLLKAGLPFLRI